MSSRLPKPDFDQKPDVQRSALKVKDVVRFLSILVRLYGNDRTGNADLSEGLRQLAKALRPHAERSVFDLADVLRPQQRIDRQTPRTRAESMLPQDLSSISADEIERILTDSSYRKVQLVELGVHRFGISQSKLVGLDRSAVKESIRAALDHERSLVVISQEARRTGTNRLS